MSQYKTGTVTVTNGSPTVTGSGTLFVANVPVGSLFTVTGSGVPYVVGAVPNDTTLTLASNYAAGTLSGQSYSCTTSFTTNQQLPYPEQKDIDTATILKRAMVKIDTLLGANFGAAGQANRVVFTDGNGNLTTSANLAFDGTNLTVDASANVSAIHRFGKSPTGDGSQTIVLNGTNAQKGWAIANSRIAQGNLEFIRMTAAGGDTIGSTPDLKLDTSGNATFTNNIVVSGAGPHAIGGVALGACQITQAGTFTSTGGNADAYAYLLSSTINPQIGGDGTLFRTAASAAINKQGSGTHADFATMLLQPPTIGAGAATLTNSTTLKISSAPSVGTNLRALWTADGQVEHDHSGAALVALFKNTNGSPLGIEVLHSTDSNGTGNQFLQCIGNATTRAELRSNGGLANFSANNVNLSDGSIKVSVRPAPDYCDFVEKAAALIKVGAYEDDPEKRMHTMWDSREIGALDASTVTPWRHSPGMVLQGLRDHEMYLRGFAATGALIRRMKVVEQRLGIQP